MITPRPTTQPEAAGPPCSSESTPSDDHDIHDIESNDISEDISLKNQISFMAWSSIRDWLRDCVVEESYLPESTLCLICSSNANLRCLKCGPKSFYCSVCFKRNHSVAGLFHVPEVWEVGKHLCGLYVQYIIDSV